MWVCSLTQAAGNGKGYHEVQVSKTVEYESVRKVSSMISSGREMRRTPGGEEIRMKYAVSSTGGSVRRLSIMMDYGL